MILLLVWNFTYPPPGMERMNFLRFLVLAFLVSMTRVNFIKPRFNKVKFKEINKNALTNDI